MKVVHRKTEKPQEIDNYRLAEHIVGTHIREIGELNINREYRDKQIVGINIEYKGVILAIIKMCNKRLKTKVFWDYKGPWQNDLYQGVIEHVKTKREAEQAKIREQKNKDLKILEGYIPITNY